MEPIPVVACGSTASASPLNGRSAMRDRRTAAGLVSDANDQDMTPGVPRIPEPGLADKEKTHEATDYPR
jgi:hypothetical protein